MRSATAVTGLAMMGLAAFLAPGPLWAPAIVGVPAALIALRPRLRWPAAVIAASLAAIMTAAADGGVPSLVEGLLILGYLLLVDSLEGLRPAVVAAALAGSGIVGLALLLPPTPRPYLVLAGLAAIAGGYAIAVPLGRRRER